MGLEEKVRQPLLEELRLMSQELRPRLAHRETCDRAAKELAVAQSRRNAQLQREANVQVPRRSALSDVVAKVSIFNTLADLQRQNRWFEERRRKEERVQARGGLESNCFCETLAENEQMKLERP